MRFRVETGDFAVTLNPIINHFVSRRGVGKRGQNAVNSGRHTFSPSNSGLTDDFWASPFQRSSSANAIQLLNEKQINPLI